MHPIYLENFLNFLSANVDLEAFGLKSLLVETKTSNKIKVKAEDSLGFCR
jgi:hypothetical protein